MAASSDKTGYHTEPGTVQKFFNDKEGLIWFSLTDYNYPCKALFLQQKIQKEALCNAQNSVFGGHNATQKT
jgi:hypothetical protein